MAFKSISKLQRGRRQRARARFNNKGTSPKTKNKGNAKTNRKFLRGVLHEVVKNHKKYSLGDIIALVKTNPAAVRERDNDGHIPLHYACSRQAPLPIVEYLLRRYPHGLQVGNKYQAFPLHYACDRGAPLEVIQLLVNAYPQALDQKALFGNLPIHLLVANEASTLEAIQFLVDQYPQGLRVANHDGMLPLQHCWMRQGVGGKLTTFSERLLYLAQKDPQTLFHRWVCGTSEKQSMLHNELSFRSRNGGPLDGLRFLLQQLYYPSQTPCVHVATIKPEPCRFVIGSRFHGGRIPQMELLPVLFDCIPKMARMAAEGVERRSRKAHGTYLPLPHYALNRTALAPMMRFLTMQCPEDLHFCDSRGRNLLSYAIWNNSMGSVGLTRNTRRESQQAVFDVILERCGGQRATSTADRSGRLALHLALSWNAPLSYIKAIRKHNPTAIFEADHYGFYPLHVAALRYYDTEGIYYLLQQDPSQLTRCKFPKISYYIQHGCLLNG